MVYYYFFVLQDSWNRNAYLFMINCQLRCLTNETFDLLNEAIEWKLPLTAHRTPTDGATCCSSPSPWWRASSTWLSDWPPLFTERSCYVRVTSTYASWARCLATLCLFVFKCGKKSLIMKYQMTWHFRSQQTRCRWEVCFVCCGLQLRNHSCWNQDPKSTWLKLLIPTSAWFVAVKMSS